MEQLELVDPSNHEEDSNLPTALIFKTEVLESKTMLTDAAETTDITEWESPAGNNHKSPIISSISPVVDPMDEEMKTEAPERNPIDHLFEKLHRKMTACQSFVTNLESFMDVIPTVELSVRKFAVDIAIQGDQDNPAIEKLISEQKKEMTNLKLLGERNDALHQEVQTLERSTFLLRRRIREGEALREIQEKNTVLMLETQQNMLKDVSEAKAAFERELENLRGELNERKAQFQAKQSQLKRMKAENDKFRKLKLEQDQQLANLKEQAQARKQNDYEKISLLTAKLEGVSADLLRSKRAHTQMKEQYKELEQKYSACSESAQTAEAQEKQLKSLKAELQRLKESNEIEKFQTQLKNLEAENFVIKNKLSQFEISKDSSSTSVEKDRQRKTEVELTRSKEKYEVTVKALNKEAQSKIEELYKRYNFFRVQMFAIYKVLLHDEKYLSVNRPKIHKAFISLKTALKKQVKVMGCNKRSLDT